MTGTLTLNYIDGTKDDFTLRLPPQNSEEASATLTGQHENDLRLVIYLTRPISAADVISVELDGVQLFSIE